MPLTTTTIGAYPKPDYVEVPDWFNIPVGPDTAEPTKGWAEAVYRMTPATKITLHLDGVPMPGGTVTAIARAKGHEGKTARVRMTLPSGAISRTAAVAENGELVTPFKIPNVAALSGKTIRFEAELLPGGDGETGKDLDRTSLPVVVY